MRISLVSNYPLTRHHLLSYLIQFQFWLNQHLDGYCCRSFVLPCAYTSTARISFPGIDHSVRSEFDPQNCELHEWGYNNAVDEVSISFQSRVPRHALATGFIKCTIYFRFLLIGSSPLISNQITSSPVTLPIISNCCAPVVSRFPELLSKTCRWYDFTFYSSIADEVKKCSCCRPSWSMEFREGQNLDKPSSCEHSLYCLKRHLTSFHWSDELTGN